MRTQMSEHLTKAEHDARFLINTLQDVLFYSNAVEALIVLRLIEQAATLQTRITEYVEALNQSQR